MSVVEVRSGFLDLASPAVADIKIEDIGHHLSNLCRFTGATTRYHSVAEHSVTVWAIVRDLRGTRREQFAALMHDAHEAYTGDLSTMFKRLLGASYYEIVHRLDAVIGEKFGIRPEEFGADVIVEADQLALAIEAHWLMLSKGEGEHWKRLPIVPLPMLHKYKPTGYNPLVAKELFMGVYNSVVATQKRDRINTTASYAL